MLLNYWCGESTCFHAPKLKIYTYLNDSLCSIIIIIKILFQLFLGAYLLI